MKKLLVVWGCALVLAPAAAPAAFAPCHKGKPCPPCHPRPGHPCKK